MRFLTNRWVQIATLLLLLCGGLYELRENDSFIKRIRLITFDTYNKILPRTPADDVRIVDIDEDSLKRYGQWPWPRTVIADIVKNLKSSGAKVIAFDMAFVETDRTSPAAIAKMLPQTEEMAATVEKLGGLPDHDAVFAQEIAAAGNVVTGFVATGQPTDFIPLLKTKMSNWGTAPDPRPFVFSPHDYAVTLPELVNAAAGNGSFIATPEEDGIIRRVPIVVGWRDGAMDNLYPSLSLETVRLLQDNAFYTVVSNTDGPSALWGVQGVRIGKYMVPTDKNGYINIYYTGHREGIYIPAWKVLDSQLAENDVKGKIVLVGTSSIGLLDLRSSPLNTIVPGVELHAEIIEQILHNKFLIRTLNIVNGELIATGLISLLIIFLTPFTGAAFLGFIVLLIVAGSGFGGLWAYQTYGYLIDPICPSIVIVMIFILSSILTNLRSEMEKRAVRQAFGHYVSPVLIEELASNPDKLKLGGEVRDVSVMFTDIRNFTTISEGMDPADLIRMMNDFLTPMTSCVLDNRGTVDKYMGDAMMAFWNAPLDDADHSRNACRAALEMVKSLGPVNDNLRLLAEKSGKPFKELKAGIGINTGRASVGNMGSKQRFAYSALGDTVNLASRLEGQTKGYGISIMLSEKTRLAAPDYAAIELDLLTVKGRTEPERIYSLLGGPDVAIESDFKVFAERHAAMLASYRAMAWDDALQGCDECSMLRPDLEGLYRLYRERIAILRSNPPEPGWSGVWVAKEK